MSITWDYFKSKTLDLKFLGLPYPGATLRQVRYLHLSKYQCIYNSCACVAGLSRDLLLSCAPVLHIEPMLLVTAV